MGEILTATHGGLKRPRLALGLGASLLLVPISFLGTHAGDPDAADLISYEADFDVASAREAPVTGLADVDNAGTAEQAARSPEPSLPSAGRRAQPSGTESGGRAVEQASSSIEPTASTTTTTTVLTATKGEGKVVASPPSSSSAPINVNVPVNLRPALQRLTGGPSEHGQASWFQAPSGTCAHQTLPFGTLVKVTNVYTGTSTTCLVDDRGPFITGRVIDLSYDTFGKLAHPGSGVINVVIEW